MKAMPAPLALPRPRAGVEPAWPGFRLLLHPRMLLYVLVVALLIGAVLLSRGALSPHPAWFVVVDATIAALALANGAIALTYFGSFGARSLLFVAMGFLGSALLRSIHLVLQLEVVTFVGLENPYNAEIASVVAAQAYLAAMLLIGWRAREWRIVPASRHVASLPRVVIVSGAVLAIFACVAILIAYGALPTVPPRLLWTVSAGAGLLYLVSLASFLAGGDWRTHHFQHGFLLFLLLICGSHLVTALDLPVISEMGLLVADAMRCLAYAAAFLTLLASTSGLLDQVSERRLDARVQSLLEKHAGLAGLAGDHAQGIAISHQLQGVGTFELDLPTGRFRGSPATAILFGSPTGIQNVRQFEDCLHPDDTPRLLRALEQSKRGGGLFKERFRIRTPDGDRWLEAIAAMDAVDGAPPRLIGFVHDISVQKALENERDRLHDALEQMVAAVDQHAATATVAPDGTIETANRLFCDDHGEPPEALRGRRLGELVRTAPGTQPLPRDLRELDPDSPWRGEVRFSLPDGSERIAQASITPRRFRGRDHHTLVYVAFDVSQRVEAEKALVESVSAHRRSNEDLQMFAHIVSHDLQEPLRMVSSFMTLLERRYAGQLDTEAREFIQFAVDGAQRMRALLDGLLEYSRVTSRGGAFEPVELGEPLAGAIGNLRVLIEESGAEVTIGSLPEVRADAAQMVQLFQNLLANAIKFCSGRIPHIEIDAHREGSTQVVTVSDNGIGIDPAHYERIFQIFQRLHGRGEYPGSGVGLAVCKRIMERHGGHIELESIMGEGTVFRLEFPAA